MATSSFDQSFRIESKKAVEVFIQALEEFDPEQEQPRATRYKGDLVEAKKRIFERYGIGGTDETDR